MRRAQFRCRQGGACTGSLVPHRPVSSGSRSGRKAGSMPFIVAVTSRQHAAPTSVTYTDERYVWSAEGPKVRVMDKSPHRVPREISTHGQGHQTVVVKR